MNLLDFILEIGDLSLFWRLWVGVFTTGTLCCLTFLTITNEVIQWVVGVPLVVVGVVLSIRWQARADFHE